MTRSTTWRIPGRLKKKLQTNLEKLSVKEAGRLWLIYSHEAHRKSIPVHEYPPSEELRTALKDRLAKSRGKPEEAQTVDHYNGVLFLQRLAVEVNDYAVSVTMALDADVFKASSRIDRFLLLDAVSELARAIRARMFDALPKPVSREEYDRILKWGSTDALLSIMDAMESLREDWIEEQNLTPVRIPFEYIHAKAEETGQDWRELEYTTSEEAIAIRRQYAEEMGLLDIFKGNRDRLEEWIQYPMLDHYIEISRDEIQAKFDEFGDKLEALIETGELEGGEGVYMGESEVLLRDGKIPALFALRAVWDAWVESRGFKIRKWWPNRIGPNGIGKIYDPDKDDDEDLDRDALEELVADFLKDVKGRPWGKGLADLRKSHMKPAALVDLLIREDDPLLQMEIDKPDWGMVDFETFADSEQRRYGRSYEAGPVATAESLTKVAAKAIGLKFPSDFARTWYEEQYYPTRDFEGQRENFARIFAMLGQIEVTNGGFAYSPDDQDLASLIGAKFMTPLEQTVETLRSLYLTYVSFDRAITLLSEFYFDGLPLVWNGISTRFDSIKGYFAEAIEDLERWLFRLERYPWKVDVSSLRIEKPDPSDDQVYYFTDHILTVAKNTLGISDADLKRQGLFFNG